MHQGSNEFLEWLRGVERKWQKLWRESRVFEPEPDPAKPKFFITVPYPYTNAPLHIGHGRTYTIGDIIARYKRLRGYNVLFPMAFHITGTPIVAISEMISRGDKKVIARYESYVRMYLSDEEKVKETLESFKDPLKLAEFFAENVHVDFDALGYSIDWRRRFHTGEPLYNKFVAWQYLKLSEKGLLTRGSHYVTYCLLHKQPEGEDDIEDADVNPVEIVEYTGVKFRLVDGGDVLLAATLRPETLYGATNLWVNPEAKYVRFRMGREVYITSEKAFVKLKHQHPELEFEVLEELPGSSLLGRRARSPLGQELVVLPAWFVDPDLGTGVVYSEPSDAPYDYAALSDLKKDKSLLARYGLDPSLVDPISPIKIIDVPGVEGHYAQLVVESMGIRDQYDERLEEATSIVYKEEFYKGRMLVKDPLVEGKPVREARDIVKQSLIGRGDAIRFLELNRKARCRAGGEIIVAKIVDQWFLDYTSESLKKTLLDYIENRLVVKPEKYKKAFVDAINWLEKRPCARKRGIGTRLPFDEEWIIESLSDSTIYMAFYTIVHKLRQAGVKPENLRPAFFDYVFLGQGERERVAAEAGLRPELLDELRREFEYWYPVDLRHTSTPHISNHLSFYLIHHAVIFPEKYWPRAITLNEPVIREGAKMSKSKGNVINLRDIAEKYSSDLFRLYIAWAASLDTVLDWREKDVSATADLLQKFTRLALDLIEGRCVDVGEDVLSRWFKSRFYRLVKAGEEAVEAHQVRDYVQNVFFNVLNLIDRYRDMRGFLPCDVKYVLQDWLKVLNPVIPHLTEEMWSRMGGGGFLSTSSWPSGYEAYFDDAAEALINEVERVVEDVKNILGAVGRKPREVYVIVASQWKRRVLELAMKGLELRDVIREVSRTVGAGKERLVSEVYRAWKSGQLDKEAVKVDHSLELDTLRRLSEYIGRKTGAVVRVVEEGEALSMGLSKAEKALPGKPGLFVLFES
ncbi:leucine--tRNA ligase [Thermogladius sp.]|uniref:leucine--tRNA ligase n=1 Tax=Thermogladius sp. TaxID=2023064 RepID=UPI003D0A11DF